MIVDHGNPRDDSKRIRIDTFAELVDGESVRIEWIGIGISLLTGVGGLVFAALAIFKSSEANRLSREANGLSNRSLAASTETWFVDWEVSWNQAGSLVNLHNTGRDTALGTSATVTGNEHLHIVETWKDGVVANADVTVLVPQILGQRAAHAAASGQRSQDGRFSSIDFPPLPFRADLKVTIAWYTGEGFARSKEYKLVVS